MPEPVIEPSAAMLPEIVLHQEWRRNPATLGYDLVVRDVPAGATANTLLARLQPGFTQPFVLLVNGQPISRVSWDAPLPACCTAHFMPMPLRGGGGNSNALQILASIAVIAAAMLVPYAFSLTGIAASLASAATMMGGTLLVNLMFAQKKKGSLPDTDLGMESLATLSAGGNRIRLAQPFPEHFGRLLFHPDLLQGGHVSIDGSTQKQDFYGLYCLGVGRYSVEQVYIDETPLTDYAGAQYNIVPPGGTPTLIPRLVWTSDEIAGQELDWENYLTAIVNPAGTQITEIEFDIVLPAGLGIPVLPRLQGTPAVVVPAVCPLGAGALRVPHPPWQ
ncbi:hypothetical protein [Megalodesulfovibrio gigas]|uniref:hypothetical protein n=1 Tax=Megalodesulfovibrio gigas TaxID=879 RepID=UPI00059EF516|nr:hypothetical protein [Megalodesulfovibrio gigas]